MCLCQMGFEGFHRFVFSKIYNKYDDFDFDKVDCHFFFRWGGGRGLTFLSLLLRGVYISQLISQLQFARVSSHVTDFKRAVIKFKYQTSPIRLSVS